jgi:Cys-rich protein (TIGR01571 family)
MHALALTHELERTQAFAGTHTRIHTHTRYQIAGSLAEDICVNFCCQPCSTCQIASTVGAYLCVAAMHVAYNQG